MSVDINICVPIYWNECAFLFKESFKFITKNTIAKRGCYLGIFI